MNTLQLLLLSGFFILSLNSFSQTQRTISDPLPSRQVHLDFHTSELIPGIGEKFDKKIGNEICFYKLSKLEK
jgi:hypothetical protein